MTSYAFGRARRVARVLALEIVILGRAVATTAHVRHFGKTWGRGSVETVTRGATRRARVLLDQERLTVNTLVVQLELVRRNVVRFH